MSITDRLAKIETRLRSGCGECDGTRPPLAVLWPGTPAPAILPCGKCGTIIRVVYRDRPARIDGSGFASERGMSL
jgi:hypothetical protein